MENMPAFEEPRRDDDWAAADAALAAPDTDEQPSDEGAAGDEAPVPATEESAVTDDVVALDDEPAAAVTDEAVRSDDDVALAEADDPADTDDDAAPAATAEEAEGAEEESEPAVADLDWQPGEWYVVHTYAGYENKVKADLESRVASMNMEESIYEVVIPMEEVMEMKSGKKQMVPRKVFPGYLLVRMEMNDDSWYVVRNTPGVTGFVGSGSKPIPLSEREVDKILRRKGEAERPKPTVEWQASDNVRVTTGPFANFQGTISEVDIERQKVKVLVNIFGRETPVELSFDQIAKV